MFRPASRFSLFLLLCFGASPLAAQESDRPALKAQQGTWVAERFVRDGQETPAEIVRSITRTVEKDHVVWKRDGKSFAGTSIELNPDKSPAAIDVVPDGGPSRGKRVLGVYRLEGDRLTICMADPDGPRPADFKADKGSRQTLMVFIRAKAGSAP